MQMSFRDFTYFIFFSFLPSPSPGVPPCLTSLIMSENLMFQDNFLTCTKMKCRMSIFSAVLFSPVPPPTPTPPRSLIGERGESVCVLRLNSDRRLHFFLSFSPDWTHLKTRLLITRGGEAGPKELSMRKPLKSRINIRASDLSVTRGSMPEDRDADLRGFR